MNTEDKKAWCMEAQNNYEPAFIEKFGEMFDLIINPAKQKHPFEPDLYRLKNSTAAELKCQFTPFYLSETKFGIPPQYVWSFNAYDLHRYTLKNCDNMEFFIWLKFKKSQYGNIVVEDTEAVYYTTLFELKRAINKRNHTHQFLKRKTDEVNKKENFIVDLRDFKRIYPKEK